MHPCNQTSLLSIKFHSVRCDSTILATLSRLCKILHPNPSPLGLEVYIQRWSTQKSVSPEETRSEPAIMDCAPNVNIFRELQVVHDTGYFSSQVSPEEDWQQVSTSIREEKIIGLSTLD